MKPEILIAIITGSISLFGVIITAWLNYKAKLLELHMKSEKTLPTKRRNNTIWFVIFGIILLGSGIYFLINQNNASSGDIIWETDKKGYFIDQRDQHKYKVVKIGNQVWMAANLAYIPTICPPDKQCGIWVYENNNYDIGTAKININYKNYGCLYDWKTATNLNDNICPDGWHLPTREEFEILINSISNDSEIVFHSLILGGTTEFNATIAGYRDLNGSFQRIGKGTHFRSASSAWGLDIENEKKYAKMAEYNKNLGFSIRCIHN